MSNGTMNVEKTKEKLRYGDHKFMNGKKEEILDRPPSWWPYIDCAYDFLDHVKYLYDVDYAIGKEAVVSEPYNISLEDIYELMEFCREHDLKFIIGGNSSWNPGNCFRITFTKKEDDLREV